MLVEKQLDPNKKVEQINDAVCVIVGVVSEHWLKTSMVSTYDPRFNALPKAKFQFMLDPPDDPNFLPDFVVAINNISEVQKGIATGDKCQYFMIDEASVKKLHFSADICELQVSFFCFFVFFDNTCSYLTYNAAHTSSRGR